MAVYVPLRRMGAGSVMADETDLYRYFDNKGQLLYVGISFSAIVRASQHKANSNWFDFVSHMTVEKFNSREDASKAEIEAIQSEKPIHNKAFANLKTTIKCFFCEKKYPSEEHGAWEDGKWMCGNCLCDDVYNDEECDGEYELLEYTQFIKSQGVLI